MKTFPLTEHLAKIAGQLHGSIVSHSASSRAIMRLRPLNVDWIADGIARFPLVGSRFEIPSFLDMTGLGARLVWLHPDEMLAEATDAYPGITALLLGYVPIGGDLTGSGDPYFCQCGANDDSRLFRIRHDCIDDSMGSLPKAAIEVVLPDLAELFPHIAR